MINTEEQHDKISGRLPVVAAIIGNFFIAAVKFAGFFLSGSGALFSEAIHSLADISNQVLLFVGIKRSTKKPDEQFAYGYGPERFFWALVSACSIFFLGAGVTVSRGVQGLMANEVPHISPIIYLILGTSFIVESFTLWLAYKELVTGHENTRFSKLLADGDPSTVAVIYEDSVAVIGVLIALASVVLTRLTGKVYWDSVGSILIGLLLGFMALVLINKNRRYLIGKTIPKELIEKVYNILNSDPTIENIIDFKSATIDINEYRIKCEVEFNSSVLLKEIYRNGFREEYDGIKDDYEEFKKFLVDHTDRIPRMIGTKIDEIEKKIKSEIPEIKHIDLEIN